jgi:transposase, IS5 family
MYQQKDPTPEFSKFEMSFGGELRRDNRWVVLGDIIPWNEVEKRYAKLFSPETGRPALPVRVALGALVIKERLKISDEETVDQIRENHYLQYFLGYEAYRDERPFDPSMMVHFRKRLSGSVLKEINEIMAPKPDREKHGNDDSGPGGSETSGDGEGHNQGTMIVDATCAPEDLRFSHDVTTLDEARRKTEKIIDEMFQSMPAGREKPRTYRRVARKRFLTFIRNRKPRKGDVKRALKSQIQFVERNLRSIEAMAAEIGIGMLSRKEHRDLMVIAEYVRQQRELRETGELSMPGRIVSIWKPHVRAIARGKARGMFEFGAKVSVSLVDGYARVERLSWDNYHEGIDLKAQIACYQERYGAYPEVVCADKIYRTRDNLDFCHKHGIRLSGPKLGRPYKDEERKRELRRIERQDEGTRVAIEGKFGEGKRTYSLDNVRMRLRVTSETSIMMAFFMMNLMKLVRDRARSLFVLLSNYIVCVFGTLQIAEKGLFEAA